MKNTIKRIANIAMMYLLTLYGCCLSGLAIYGVITDDIYASTRMEVIMLMTCLPAMISGLRALRNHWVAQELSKRQETIRVELTDKAA